MALCQDILSGRALLCIWVKQLKRASESHSQGVLGEGQHCQPGLEGWVREVWVKGWNVGLFLACRLRQTTCSKARDRTEPAE